MSTESRPAHIAALVAFAAKTPLTPEEKAALEEENQRLFGITPVEEE